LNFSRNKLNIDFDITLSNNGLLEFDLKPALNVHYLYK